MPAVFVVHANHDLGFVTDHVLPPLPALGFDHWLTADMLARGPADRGSLVAAMRFSAVVVAVLSEAARQTADIRAQIELALQSGRPIVPVRLGSAPREVWPEAVVSLPAVDVQQSADAVDDDALWEDLAALLPQRGVSGTEAQAGLGLRATPIPWNADVFSRFLEDAVQRHDYNRGDALVAAFTQHLGSRAVPYPVAHLRKDLAALRKKRQFRLMRRYAAAALESGTADFRVRRQFAQSLIELAEFSLAVRVLEQIVAEAAGDDPESYEARGLLGRVYKQQYVNAPAAPGSSAHLLRAIDVYASVFRENQQHVWHGINAVSCLLRAARDGIDGRRADDARAMAAEVLAELERRRRGAQSARSLDVWDQATRVEALLALGSHDAAADALDEYLTHPDIDAFEVSSTYRQFDEVLRLGDDERSRPLLERVWHAVERHRAGGATLPRARRAGADHSSPASATRPLLLRVSAPDWQPVDVPDLAIDARLGTMLSISGTDRTVKALMKDPQVIAVDESRRSQQPECDRSLPFINVTDPFPGPAGAFTEKGSGALVAVIDDGIDILHRAFLDDNGRSRIVGIWDQRDQTGPPPPGFGFGKYYPRETIARLVAENSDPTASSSTIPAALTRDANGHGTHVASIAAGRRSGAFAGGVAPEASLLIVISGAHEAIGYSTAHVAALTFIDRISTSLALPVVVNVSQGMNAGAHDGKSLVEVAFDEFSKGGRAPGRVVVKSAGNERITRGHAEVSLQPDSADALRWTCRDPWWYGDRLELWWNSANEFRFRLVEPTGEASGWVDQARPAASGELGGARFELQLVRRHVDNGDSRLAVEVASEATPLRAGAWAIDIQSVKIAEPGAIHAWIERSNSTRSEFLSHDHEGMTLSIPGTAYSVITVAAIDASKPIVVGSFSSHGPTRDGRRKPDVCAPGVNVHAARGGTFDDVRQDSGTSMAAPHVTGAIALLLSRAAKAGQEWPAATQIGAMMRQKTLNYSGQWTPGQGYGVLDVAALLSAC